MTFDFDTGCVSIATTGEKSAVTVDRVIEYFYPRADGCSVWVDVFFTSRSDAAGELLVLHRGSFVGQDATCESWLDSESANGESLPRALTRRICELHGNDVPIAIAADGVVSIDGIDYQVWNERERNPLLTVVGNDPVRNVPFTLWQVGPVRSGRSVFRIWLEMCPATFAAGIGRDRRFFACGESILLDKIAREDLPSYAGTDAAQYIAAFERFERGDHVTPEAFEYLVIAPEGVELRWQTAALSPRLIEPAIRSRGLQRCTRWFVADTSAAGSWYLTGKAYSSFVVKVDATSDDLLDAVEFAALKY